MLSTQRLAPVHAVLSSIPLGLFVGVSILDLASLEANEPDPLVRAAFWLMLVAVLAAVLAGVPGILRLRQFDSSTARAFTGRKHLVLTDAGIVAGVGALLAARGNGFTLTPLALGLTLAATAFMIVGAWVAASARVQAQVEADPDDQKRSGPEPSGVR